MDNGTMVGAFKYLTYCQLAKHSLVSKRFRNLIQTHRHKLALLYVQKISMDSFQVSPIVIRVFGNELSPEAYNEWLMHNNYMKQAPTESHVVSEESTQSFTNRYRYEFAAYAYYKDSGNCEWNGRMTVFSASVELNHKIWPVFQHFVRLITDPFIDIDSMELVYQNDVLNLLAEAMNSGHDRLQCNKLTFHFKCIGQKSITWIKNYTCCNKLHIFGEGDLNQDEYEALLDFFVTGANCTPSIAINYRYLSKVVTDFVHKFMDLKNSGESQLVQSIAGKIRDPAIEVFQRNYAAFIVKEDISERSTTHFFEFVNTKIEKKLQLTTVNHYIWSDFTIKINNL